MTKKPSRSATLARHTVSKLIRKQIKGTFAAAILGVGWGKVAKAILDCGAWRLIAVDDYGDYRRCLPKSGVTMYDLADDGLREEMFEAASKLVLYRSDVDFIAAIPRIASKRHDVASRWLELIYVDYDRSEHGLLADVRAWLPCLARDGILCGFGYRTYGRGGGVTSAVSKLAKELHCKVNLAGNSVWWMKPTIKGE